MQLKAQTLPNSKPPAPPAWRRWNWRAPAFALLAVLTFSAACKNHSAVTSTTKDSNGFGDGNGAKLALSAQGDLSVAVSGGSLDVTQIMQVGVAIAAAPDGMVQAPLKAKRYTALRGSSDDLRFDVALGLNGGNAYQISGSLLDGSGDAVNAGSDDGSFGNQGGPDGGFGGGMNGGGMNGGGMNGGDMNGGLYSGQPNLGGGPSVYGNMLVGSRTVSVDNFTVCQHLSAQSAANGQPGMVMASPDGCTCGSVKFLFSDLNYLNQASRLQADCQAALQNAFGLH